MSAETIRKAIKTLSGESPVTVLGATVKSVDWDKRHCTVTLDDDTEIPNVRLRAVLDKKTAGWCMKPKADSRVLIAMIESMDMNWCVIQCSELDAIELLNSSGDVLVMDVANGDFSFNGGGNDGLIKIKEAVKKFNELEKDINTLKTGMQAVLTAPVNEMGLGNPSAFQIAMNAAIANWYAQSLNMTVQSDLENAKVKH